jgi:hypothetical protein
MNRLYRFSMILISVLLIGGAIVLAISAGIAYAEGSKGSGFLRALGAITLLALWSISSWRWRVAGYWKREK